MNVRKWLKNFWYLILLFLLGIFIGGWLAYTTVVLWGDQQLANAYIAIGTLILAFATALLAFFSWQNIKSGYAREKRDRKERRLNEIIAWATQVLEYGRTPAFIEQRLRSAKKDKSFEFELNMAALATSNVLTWRAVHIGFLAQHSISDKELSNAVENTRVLVRQQVKILSLAVDYKLKDGSAIGRHRKKVDDSAKRVIELAVKLL